MEFLTSRFTLGNSLVVPSFAESAVYLPQSSLSGNFNSSNTKSILNLTL